MRSVQSEVVSVLDVRASQLICEFATASGTDEEKAEEIKCPGLKFASSVILTSGSEPSFALVTIPIGSGLDEIAPTVALVGTGPTGEVRLRYRCKISYYDSVLKKKFPIMVGSIIQFNHQIGEDTATALIMDDRYFMSKVTCWGKVKAYKDPDSNTWIQYLDNVPLTFNSEGPDCVDSSFGPRFASDYRWGWNTNNYTEPTPCNATDRARSWRLMDIYQYIASLYTYGEASIDSIVQQGEAKIRRAPNWLFVPQQAAGGTELQGFYRIKKHFECQGKTLLVALQDVCRAAGAYDLYMEPYGDSFKSITTIVNLNPNKVSGVVLNLPSQHDWDLSKIVNDPAGIARGQVTESIANYHDQVEIIGESPYLELMVSTKEDDSIGGGILEKAWTAEDETAFKALVKTLGDDKEGFETACKQYPLVYCGYRINPAKFTAFLSGTKYEKWRIFGHPRILPHLLTNIAGDIDSNSSLRTNNPNNWIPKDIIAEYWNWELGESAAFAPGTKYDGLALSPERSTLLLPGMRDKKQTWKTTRDDPSGYSGEYMSANDVRLTLAVELMSPLCSMSGNGSNGPDDPNYTVGRVQTTFREYVTYTTLGQPNKMDYVEFLRKGSHPAGTDVPEPHYSENFPDKCTVNSELFSDRPTESTGRMAEHSRKRLADIKRVEVTGQIILSTFHCGIKPGTNLRVFGGGKITPVAVCKSVRLDPVNQQIIIECASHDSSVIYDMPMAVGVPDMSPPNPAEGNNKEPTRPKVTPEDVGYTNESLSQVAQKQSILKVEKKAEPKADDQPNIAQARPLQIKSDTTNNLQQVRGM
jgi:hypothetical protein